MLNLLFVALEIVLLTAGGEALIRGSLAAASGMGFSPLLSGLLILGLCAVITPLAVKPLVLQRDAVTVVAASILFLVLVGGKALARSDAAIFLLALVAYLVWAYRTERSGAAPSADLHRAAGQEVTVLLKTTLWIVMAVVEGLLFLIMGSQVLLKGAVGIAESFGLSEAVIGLTLVAVGRSLPELSISVIAAFRRHDAEAYSQLFTADGDVVNVMGWRWRGREEIRDRLSAAFT